MAGTQADNTRDAVNRDRYVGKMLRGIKHYRAKLTDDDVRAIRADDRLYKEIEADYWISNACVSAIKNRKRRQHVS